MTDLVFAALALMLVIEGILPFTAPRLRDAAEPHVQRGRLHRGTARRVLRAHVLTLQDQNPE